MRKDYYNPMRNLAIIVPFLAAALFSGGPVAQPPQATLKAAALESHEGVTISAQPWTDAASYKAKFPKKSPFTAGVVAIDTIIRNDTDDSMKIDLEQIRLNVTLVGGQPPSAALADGRRCGRRRDGREKKGSHEESRTPISDSFQRPKSRPRQALGTEMQKAAADAGIPGSIVAPHHSMRGTALLRYAGTSSIC